MKPILLLLSAIVFFASCQSYERKLPILGNKDIQNGDTLYHTIPAFSFLDQDSQVVTNKTFEGKAYVADFFFIACPTICPKTAKQMLRIHDQFKTDDRLLLCAFSVAGKQDTVPALKRYARNLGVESSKWHFLTGPQDDVYEIADDYFSIAMEDPSAPGGYDHSGRLILIDKKQHIRSFCDGTDPEDVDRFMEDIQILLNEK